MTSGGATITGNSNITGTLNSGQFLSSGQIANTSGGMSINGTSSVIGSFTSSTLSTLGNAGIGGTLTSGGPLTVQSGGASITGATTMQALTCSGITSSGNTLNVNNLGAIKSINLTSTGNVTTTGVNACWLSVYSGAVSQSNAAITLMANSNGVQLTSGATSWSAYSGERLKDVTGTYDNALEDLKQLKPIKFTWKQHPENGPQVGVIAQSVQNVVPEAMNTLTYPTDGNEYLGVRYAELIPILIAGLQEATTRIEALEAQVALLTPQ